MAVTITQTANPAGVSASSNVATYTAASIGTAAPNRIVVVVVGSELASTPIASCTIDGNAMTAGTQGNQGAVYSNLFYLAYPTGTTANIAVTFTTNSPSSTQNHIAVYSVVGGTYSSKGGAQSTDMDSTAPLTTGSISIASGGGFIAVAAKATDTVRAAWANATEDLDVDAGAFGFTTATRTTALTTTAVTCTGTTNGEDGAISWIIFTANVSPTTALNTPADTVKVADTTPTLDFTGTDTESNDVRYNTQIYKQIATDNFNRADSATLGSNWTTCNGDDGNPHDLKIVSNQVKPTDSAVDNIARRTAETFSNDQYSQVTLSNIDTGSHLGCGVRFSANNGYIGQVRKASSVLRITKKTGTTYATLTENAVTLSNGDVIRIEAFGSKISLYQNGVFVNSVVDTDFATGQPAINADATGDILDNWEGGDIVVDAVSGTDAGFANPDNGGDTDPFTSGENIQYTVQSALTAGTTYYWRVRGIDPSGSNSYGAWATTRSFTILTAALTGTVTASITEADIVTGGKTIILTLTGDTWIAAGAGSFDLQRDEIIAGIDSAQSEATGWDLVPKLSQSLGGVVRTSDTVVTITLDAFATYNITAQETITATIPATALTGGVAVVASPTFTIDTSGGGTTVKTLAVLGVG